MGTVSKRLGFGVAATVLTCAGAAGATTVTVSSWTELRSAVEEGVDRILVEPGTYVFEERLELVDVAVAGLGDTPGAVVFKIPAIGSGVDYQQPPLDFVECLGPGSTQLREGGRLGSRGAMLTVAGNVTLSNIRFEGLRPPLGGYIWSTEHPCAAGNAVHHIAVRGCEFVAESPTVYQAMGAVMFGNLGACAQDCARSLWVVTFEDNQIWGFERGVASFFGVMTANWASDSPGARVEARVERNLVDGSYNGLLGYGAGAGAGGALHLVSIENDFRNGGGMTLVGGGDAISWAPGTGGEVTWLSQGDRFEDMSDTAIAVWGAVRHPASAGGMGNQVRATIHDPTIIGPRPTDPRAAAMGDICLAGGYAEGAKHSSVNDEGEGNRVELTLTGARFFTASGDARDGAIRVDHQIHYNHLRKLLPNRNQALITGSPRSFALTNAAVEQAPAPEFFTSAPR